MLQKIKDITNSWYIGMATTGLLGIALLSYGYKLYAGLALGWALCKTWEFLTATKK
jgi:hypothetical protein